jgi:succinoglycan biosynthesis protein ExoM
MSSIAVCIPTYRRPAQLRVTLESLARADGANCVMNVLVVDNDARRTAETVVAAAAPKLNVRYLVEPRRGLANVRNTLVEAALATECQYLLFLDDDEWVDEAWVSELLSTLRRFDADVVCGPVIPVFSPSVPPWIVRGGFFNRPRYVTGARLRMAATNNAIVKRAVIDRLVKHEGGRPLFDGRLNLCSGEDTHFFLRLRHVDAMVRRGDCVRAGF